MLIHSLAPVARRVCRGRDIARGEGMRLTTGAELTQPTGKHPTTHESVRRCRSALWTTRLRLYRYNSIKLMLAWETCCRSGPLFYPPFFLTVGCTNQYLQLLDPVSSSPTRSSRPSQASRVSSSTRWRRRCRCSSLAPSVPSFGASVLRASS